MKLQVFKVTDHTKKRERIVEMLAGLQGYQVKELSLQLDILFTFMILGKRVPDNP